MALVWASGSLPDEERDDGIVVVVLLSSASA